jgi:hypothetical protein
LQKIKKFFGGGAFGGEKNFPGLTFSDYNRYG